MGKMIRASCTFLQNMQQYHTRVSTVLRSSTKYAAISYTCIHCIAFVDKICSNIIHVYPLYCVRRQNMQQYHTRVSTVLRSSTKYAAISYTCIHCIAFVDKICSNIIHVYPLYCVRRQNMQQYHTRVSTVLRSSTKYAAISYTCIHCIAFVDKICSNIIHVYPLYCVRRQNMQQYHTRVSTVLRSSTKYAAISYTCIHCIAFVDKICSNIIHVYPLYCVRRQNMQQYHTRVSTVLRSSTKYAAISYTCNHCIAFVDKTCSNIIHVYPLYCVRRQNMQQYHTRVSTVLRSSTKYAAISYTCIHCIAFVDKICSNIIHVYPLYCVRRQNMQQYHTRVSTVLRSSTKYAAISYTCIHCIASTKYAAISYTCIHCIAFVDKICSNIIHVYPLYCVRRQNMQQYHTRVSTVLRSSTKYAAISYTCIHCIAFVDKICSNIIHV